MATIPGATETASVTWQAMTPVPGQTEALLVTWQAFTAAPGSETIAGETVTSDGLHSFTATQVAEAAFGLPIAGLTASGPSAWSVSAQAGKTTTLLSNAPNQPVAAPTDAAASGSGGTPAAAVITAGAAPVDTGTESIGGETVSGSGAFTAAQVAQVADGAAGIPGLVVTAEPTLWTVGPAQGAATVFTSTTPDSAAAAPSAGSSTGDAAAPSAIVTMAGAPPRSITPAVTAVTVPADGTYGDGQVLDFTTAFNEPVFVSGTPVIPIDLTTGGVVDADYVSGSGTSALTFQFQVQPGEQDLTGIATGPAIDLNGSLILDASGTQAALTLAAEPSTAAVDVDAVLPAIRSVAVPANGDYGVGQELDFTVNLDQGVTVDTAGGVPSIPLSLASGNTVQARYLSGSGTSSLTFGYVVAPGDLAPDGPALSSAIRLGGGTIEDALGNPAALALAGLASTAGVMMDGAAPSAPEFDAGGEITNTATPSLAGSAAAGSTVTLLEGTAVLGTAVAGASGSFTISPGIALALGENSLTATASTAGEASSAAAFGVFVLPAPVGGVSTSQAPTAPIATALTSGASLAFVSGTEAVELQDGVLSVGPDTNEATIERLYEGLLGRSGDPAGLSYYDGQLGAGMAKPQVASEILASPEYGADQGSQTPQQLVGSLYQGLLGRSAASDPRSDFWLGLLTQGASPGAVAAGIADSAEAKAHLAADTAQLYVPKPAATLATELYKTGLGRAPDPASLATIVATAATLPPIALAASLASSAEFAADHPGQLAAALVGSFYVDGLGRAPDPAGAAFWTGQLAGGASVATVLLGVATSPEAAAHLAPVLSV